MITKEMVKKILLSLYHYFCFFLLMAFVITCCTMLFVSTMQSSMGIELTEENITTAARLTFLNVALLSLVCTIIDAIRRKVTVDRPVKKIIAAAEQITKGNYDARVPKLCLSHQANGMDEIAECFNKMAEELSGTETLQTDFIANVSHELKTPLAVMQNYGTLLQSPDLSEEERVKYAKSITDASRRLADLVTNILKLNKLENQQIYPAVKKYELNEQLCECLLNFENVWEDKDIEIDTELGESIFIDADAELLSLVWNNLISNAFKFTEKGGTVSVSLTAEGSFVIVRVSDTGCGITPEVGKHIFDKFYQGDTSHATQGNGLGLALVKRVVDIMQGEISVESVPGKGSTFTVKIRRGES